MPIHQLKLISRTEIANNTFKLMFEKPAGFTFKPGQYGGFTLINPIEKDPAGLTRRFSLASTPNDPHIAIITRLQNSAYKRSLLALNAGDEIKFAGPTGIFTLHPESDIPAVFIAGGIGIAPFLSMIHDAIQQSDERSLLLLYGNQSAADAAYLAELCALQKTHPSFQCIPTLLTADADWQGEVGYVTYEMVKKYIPDYMKPIYYVCGSPAMVTAIQELLAEMGINEDNIKVEDFPGY